MYQAQGGARVGGEALLIVGVIVQYAATRLALGGVRGDAVAPGHRALAQWLPIAATALAALAMRQPGVAIALVFGSSVACLSLVVGLSGYVSPPRQLPPTRRVWVLVLPAAILVMLAGFHGSFTWYHAIMLLIMGMAFLGVWTEPSAEEGVSAVDSQPDGGSRAGILIVAALAVAAIGAWAAARGAVVTGEHSRMLTGEFLGATVLSPLLLLPALGAGSIAAQRGHMGEVTSSLCGTVLLNLCALLPLIILANYLIEGFAHLHTAPGLRQAFAAAATPYPLVTWRVDSIVLIVLGFALIPIAMGRWLPERFESMLLVAVYAAYLAAETAVAARLVSG